jgi:hypothetical protein
MNKRYTKCLIISVLNALFTAIAHANSVKFNSPKVREELILTGKRLLEPPKPLALASETIIDPFSGVSIAPADQNDSNPSPVQTETEESPTDVIAKLAREIPATGTILFGEKRFLLAGKKKYKTGDVVQVKYKDTNYDLIITNVTATTFTIEFNKITHSRAVK